MPEKKHEVNLAAGITPEIAAELDRQLAESETGDPDGTVNWDSSSETWAAFAQADVGRGTFARHEVSYNEQVAFASLVHRVKNEHPDLEYDEAYDTWLRRRTGLVPAGLPGPDALEVGPRTLASGGVLHQTLAVTGYPREVGPGWLQPARGGCSASGCM